MMQRLLKNFSRLGIVAAIALLALPAMAATIAVDGTTCTLPNAITAANTDTATSGCTAGSGDDTLNLGSALTITLSSEVTVSSNIVINGNGSTLGPSGSNRRAFVIESGNTAALNNMTIQNFSRSADSSAGIFSEGTLTVNSITFDNNTVTFSGAKGAAIRQNGGTLTVNSSLFTNNAVQGDGGAIAALGDASVTISKSRFHGNAVTTSSGDGAAVYHESSGTLTITNSSFSDNAAENRGQAIHITSSAGTATLRHLTLIDNGDGTDGASDTASLHVVSGATVHLYNSVIYGTDVSGSNDYDCTGTLSTNTGNLIGTSNCGTPASTSDPQLSDSDTDYVYTPATGSPIIDAVDCLTGTNAVDEDIYGKSRPKDGNGTDDNSDSSTADECDIGAYELPASNATITVTSADFSTNTNSHCSLPEAMHNANSADQVYSDCAPGGTDSNTINLTNLSRDLSLGGSLPEITANMTINGNGETIDGTNNYRHFKVTDGDLKLDDLTLKRGRATDGGSIKWDSDGTLTITKVSFLDNTATGSGGAIDIVQGTVNITNSTFSGSTTGSGGQALHIRAGTVNLKHITIVDSDGGGDAAVNIEGGTVTLQNSILAGSTQSDCGGTLDSASSYNMIESNECTGASNSISGGRDLQALSGGVIPLGASSAAIDAAPCLTGVTEDQVGTDRPQDGNDDGNNDSSNCDAGAYEFPAPAATPTPTDTPDPGDGGGNTPGDGGDAGGGDDGGSDGGGDDGDGGGDAGDGGGDAGDGGGDAGGGDDGGDAGDGGGGDAGDGGSGDDMTGDGDADDDGSGDDAGAGSADTARRRRATATPAPTNTPVPTKPLGQVLNEQGYQITAAGGMHSGVQFKQLDGAGVGSDAVIARGFIDAIDVFGWVSQGVTVCFKQLGAVVFLDAANSPRTAEDIASYATADGRTCVDLNRAGTLVLVQGSPTTAAMPAGTSGLSDCMVTLTDILNFRDGPGGDIMGILPESVTLTALERTADWFKVDYHGAQGWVSANYVTESGDCG